MQRMTLFLNLASERFKDGTALTVVMIENWQGLWSGRPLMESTSVGRGKDIHNDGECRRRDTSWDATLPLRALSLYLTDFCTHYCYSIFMCML